MNDVLTNRDIVRLMGDYPNFKGVKSHDMLGNMIKVGESVVINLDDQEGSGTHWVCCLNGGRNSKFYFDSFGIRPSDAIVKWLKGTESLARGTGVKIYFSTSQVQRVDSQRCGWYCVYILKKLYGGMSFYDAVMTLGVGSSEENEMIVKQ